MKLYAVLLLCLLVASALAAPIEEKEDKKEEIKEKKEDKKEEIKEKKEEMKV